MLTSEIEEMGALGIIATNPGERIHWSTASTIWGTPGVEDMNRLPKIPSLAVNRHDGVAVLAAAKRGETVTIRTELQQGWFPQNLPVVHIEGAREPDRFVFLHGHYDSWQVGVGDNGTGNACMVEIARVLWEQRKSLAARCGLPGGRRIPPAATAAASGISTSTRWTLRKTA